VEIKRRKATVRAVQKAGFANRRMSLSKRPDGTLTIEVAAAAPVEVSLDGLDDIVNEWDVKREKRTERGQGVRLNTSSSGSITATISPGTISDDMASSVYRYPARRG
jgi:hypothetical protein